MKSCLVLEGGALRGMYTAGVLDVMMENGLTVDAAVGVSAGAAFGCNVKSRQIGRAIRYNKKYCKDPRYCGVLPLLTTGNIFGADFCFREIPDILDRFDAKAYKENPMQFYVVCTDVDTGRPVYHLCPNGDEKDIEWIRASASMPMVSRPVEIDGHRYLDGGISDSIPLAWAQKQGFDRCVVVLTRPRSYRKKPSRMNGLMLLALRKQPEVLHRMLNRHIDYNRCLNEIHRQEQEGKILVICPSRTVKIGRLEKDPAVLEEMYRLGRSDTLKRLEELKHFLAK